MAWGYSASITIDKDLCGTANSTDFPVFISGTYDGTGSEPDLRQTAHGGRVTSTSGYDICFYSDEALTTQLDHEINTYNHETGAFSAWVRVSTLDVSNDVVIYMAYGDASITTSQEDITGVWDSGYKAVWHFKNATDFLDSTSNDHDMTNDNSTFITSPPTGVGRAVDNNQNVYTPEHADWYAGTSPTTWEGWTYFTGFNSWGIILCHTDNVNFETEWQQNESQGQRFRFGQYNYASGSSNQIQLPYNFATGQWYHIVHTTEHSPTNKGIVYINGTVAATASISGDIADVSGTYAPNLYIGRNEYFAGRYLSGRFTEFRISKGTTRTASYVTATYNNINSPSTFYAMGTEISGNANPAKPTNSTPTDGATGFPIIAGTLTASAFSDTDVADTHGSSIWQVSGVTNFATTAWTSGWSTGQLTAATINATNGTFASGTAFAYLGTYYWRVSYADDKGGSSSFSDYTSFVTSGSPAAAITWNSEPVKNIAKAIVDVSKRSQISTTGTVPITIESNGIVRLDLFNNDFYYSSGSAWYKTLKNNSTGTLTVGTMGTANIKVGTVSTLVASTANVSLGTFGTIVGTVGTINNLVASTINASLGTYGTIIGTVGTVPTLNSSTANIGLGTFGTLVGTVGTVPTLNSSTANIGLGTFGTLVGTVGTIPTFNSSTANIGLATVGIGANNVVLNSTQGLRLNGSATVWEDQMVDIGRLRTGPLGTAPTWGTLNGAEVLNFLDGTVSSVSFTTQIPHSAKVGGSIEFHLHVSPAGTNDGTVLWQFAHSWAALNGSFPTQSTVNGTQTVAANKTNNHLLFNFDNVGTNPGISSMLLCSLARIGTATGDTFGTTMQLLQADFHYERDSIGSDEETSKT